MGLGGNGLGDRNGALGELGPIEWNDDLTHGASSIGALDALSTV